MVPKMPSFGYDRDGWLVHLLPYRLTIGWLSGSFRYFVPAVVLVSIYSAYSTWRATESYTRPLEAGRVSKPDNPMTALASLFACHIPHELCSWMYARCFIVRG